MKRFRVVQERKENVATETDLRGLGKEPVFQHSHPIAVLTLLSNTDIGAIVERIADGSIHKLKSHKMGNRTHLYISDEIPGAHKKDAIQLFVAALGVASIGTEKARFVLWEASPLRSLLSNAIQGQNVKNTVAHAINQHFAAIETSEAHYLRVDSSVSIHLHQAGFQGFALNGAVREISMTEARLILKHEVLAQGQVTAPMRKVAG